MQIAALGAALILVVERLPTYAPLRSTLEVEPIPAAIPLAEIGDIASFM